MNQLNDITTFNNNIENQIIKDLYPDPDDMTPEQLLELQERIGYVSVGLSKKQIEKIPEIIFNKSRAVDKIYFLRYYSFFNPAALFASTTLTIKKNSGNCLVSITITLTA